MLKRLFKTTLIVLIINLSTYFMYLILRILGLLRYYEFEEEYANNLPVSIFFFTFSIIITSVIFIFINKEKISPVIFLAEMFILGIMSTFLSVDLLNINCSGLNEILQAIQYNILHNKAEIDIFFKSISPVLSTFIYYLTINIGNKFWIIWIFHN